MLSVRTYSPSFSVSSHSLFLTLFSSFFFFLSLTHTFSHPSLTHLKYLSFSHSPTYTQFPPPKHYALSHSLSLFFFSLSHTHTYIHTHAHTLTHTRIFHTNISLSFSSVLNLELKSSRIQQSKMP